MIRRISTARQAAVIIEDRAETDRTTNVLSLFATRLYCIEVSENHNSEIDNPRISYIEVMIDGHKVVVPVSGLSRRFTIQSSKRDKVNQMPEEYNIDSAAITGVVAVPDEASAREDRLNGISIESALFDDEGVPRSFTFIDGIGVGKQAPD